MPKIILLKFPQRGIGGGLLCAEAVLSHILNVFAKSTRSLISSPEHLACCHRYWGVGEFITLARRVCASVAVVGGWKAAVIAGIAAMSSPSVAQNTAAAIEAVQLERVKRSQLPKKILGDKSLPPTIGRGANFDPANYFENGKLIRAPKAIAAYGPDLFGDRVNLYRGSLEFVQTDVSLPGNNDLPVAVTRRLLTGGRGNYGQGLFSEWDLEIPRLHGVFHAAKGWVKVDALNQESNLRCSNFGAPPGTLSYPLAPGWYAKEYWHGNFLTVPGEGTQEVLSRNMATNANVPSDGEATPLVTTGLWAIRCLSTLSSTTSTSPYNERGEGFLAIAPNGFRYRFDWLVSRPAGTLTKQASFAGAHVSMDRVDIWILPTVVTDRFGNTVSYTYDSADKWKLLSIQSSDGRSISFNYVGGTRRVSSVNDGTRTWRYEYATVSHPNGIAGSWTNLSAVTLPDSSAWNFTGMRQANGYQSTNNGLLDMELEYPEEHPGTVYPTECDMGAINGIASPAATGSMVHPSAL
jgi:YD repeat-containing protein